MRTKSTSLPITKHEAPTQSAEVGRVGLPQLQAVFVAVDLRCYGHLKAIAHCSRNSLKPKSSYLVCCCCVALGLKLNVPAEKEVYSFTAKQSTREWIASSDRAIGGELCCVVNLYLLFGVLIRSVMNQERRNVDGDSTKERQRPMKRTQTRRQRSRLCVCRTAFLQVSYPACCCEYWKGIYADSIVLGLLSCVCWSREHGLSAHRGWYYPQWLLRCACTDPRGHAAAWL